MRDVIFLLMNLTVMIADANLTLFALIFRMVGCNDKFIAKKQLRNERSRQRYDSLFIKQKEEFCEK